MNTARTCTSARLFRLSILAPVMLWITMQALGAMSLPRPAVEIRLEGRLNTSCVPHNGGTVYLNIQLTTGAGADYSGTRRRMNLAVVLDRSGSMADDRKLDYAKRAILSLVDHLSPNDYLSIIVYDDQIETVFPMQPVRDRNQIKRLLKEIYPRGATNLGGGMMEGFREIDRDFRRDCVNRVILLSDGLANRGITDLRELDDIARGYRNKSISLSTIGVGLDYNENLMLGLADYGGGNYYYVESPHQLASIFEHELSGMSSLLAQNARIEVTPGRGVTVSDAIGCLRNQEGDKWIISIGDLYAHDKRDFTLELQIPEGAGTMVAASGVLKYESERSAVRDCPGFSVDIHYTDDAAELLKSKDWDTQAKVDIGLSSRKVERAMESLDAGNREDAARQLNEATAGLASSPAVTKSVNAAALIQSQIKQLQSYSDSVKDKSTDVRRVKKSVQYENYKSRRKN
ncbi:MAG TPA: VWA domain-containing protein [Bacteroidota bacterium]|nr:VWA domain-containing protein [Bacteroidota bacterium]